MISVVKEDNNKAAIQGAIVLLLQGLGSVGSSCHKYTITKGFQTVKRDISVAAPLYPTDAE